MIVSNTSNFSWDPGNRLFLYEQAKDIEIIGNNNRIITWLNFYNDILEQALKNRRIGVRMTPVQFIDYFRANIPLESANVTKFKLYVEK